MSDGLGCAWGGAAAMPGCADGGWPPRRRRAELAQPLFELAVAVLQFLVLAGQLPELLLEPLDPHFRVAVIGLFLLPRGTLLRTLPWKRELRGGDLHGRSQHHGDRRGAGSVKESG